MSAFEANEPVSAFSVLLTASEVAAAPAVVEETGQPDVTTDVMALWTAPFVSADDKNDQEEAVSDAITAVIKGLLLNYFPSTMARYTKNAITMIVSEALSWACPDGNMFSIQCTATSKVRSGHALIPPLHVPAKKAQYYEDEADVEKQKLNRPFFKTLGKLSKFTLWWALFETGNTPDTLPTADSLRRASSVGFGGGQATLVNIDA